MELMIKNLVIIIVTVLLKLCLNSVCGSPYGMKIGSNIPRPYYSSKAYAYSSALANESPELKSKTSDANPVDLEIFWDKDRTKLIGGGKLVKIKRDRQCKNNFIGLRQHPRHKQYYYICQSNQIILGRCEKPEVFDDTYKYCISKNHNVPTVTGVSQGPQHKFNVSECYASGVFAVNRQPRYYYTCIYLAGKFLQKICKCPRGTVFNSTAGACVERVKIVTPTLTSALKSTKYRESVENSPCSIPGSYSDDGSSGDYYKCCLKSNGEYYQVKLRCSSGRSFDNLSQECVIDSDMNDFMKFPEHSIADMIRQKKQNLLQNLPRLMTSRKRLPAKRVIKPTVDTNFCGCCDVNANAKKEESVDSIAVPKNVRSYNSCIECIPKENLNHNCCHCKFSRNVNTTTNAPDITTSTMGYTTPSSLPFTTTLTTKKTGTVPETTTAASTPIPSESTTNILFISTLSSDRDTSEPTTEETSTTLTMSETEPTTTRGESISPTLNESTSVSTTMSSNQPETTRYTTSYASTLSPISLDMSTQQTSSTDYQSTLVPTTNSIGPNTITWSTTRETEKPTTSTPSTFTDKSTTIEIINPTTLVQTQRLTSATTDITGQASNSEEQTDSLTTTPEMESTTSFPTTSNEMTAEESTTISIPFMIGSEQSDSIILRNRIPRSLAVTLVTTSAETQTTQSNTNSSAILTTEQLTSKNDEEELSIQDVANDDFDIHFNNDHDTNENITTPPPYSTKLESTTVNFSHDISDYDSDDDKFPNVSDLEVDNSSLKATTASFEEDAFEDDNISDSTYNSHSENLNVNNDDIDITTPARSIRSVNSEKTIGDINFEFESDESFGELNKTAEKLPEPSSIDYFESNENVDLESLENHYDQDQSAKSTSYPEIGRSTSDEIKNEYFDDANKNVPGTTEDPIDPTVQPDSSNRIVNKTQSKTDNRLYDIENLSTVKPDSSNDDHLNITVTHIRRKSENSSNDIEASDAHLEMHGVLEDAQLINKASERNAKFKNDNSNENAIKSKTNATDQSRHDNSSGLHDATIYDNEPKKATVPEFNHKSDVTVKIVSSPLSAKLDEDGSNAMNIAFNNYDNDDDEINNIPLPTTCSCGMEPSDDQSESSSNSKTSDAGCCTWLTEGTSDSGPADITLCIRKPCKIHIKYDPTKHGSKPARCREKLLKFT